MQSPEKTSEASSGKTKLVIYTDGSASPNPGFIGYGLHAFQYTDQNTGNKKYSSPKGYQYTQDGYQPSSECIHSVIPTRIYEYIGTYADQATNNAAEALAFKKALTLSRDLDSQYTLIKTDSQYVIKAYTEHLDRWANNGWLTQANKPVANQPIWQQIYQIKQTLKPDTISVVWVKGHDGQPGNETADKLSSMARSQSALKQTESIELEYSPDEYYKPSYVKHPLICKAWMYFRGNNSFIPGEYYLGNIGKDTQFLGKSDPDGAYAIIQLKTPDPILESIRKIQVDISGVSEDMYVTNLRSLYAPERYTDFLKYGRLTLVQKSNRRKDLYFRDYIPTKEESLDTQEEDSFTDSAQAEPDESHDKYEPITRQQFPPLLGYRVFDCLTVMKQKLSEYQKGGNEALKIIDITDTLYESQETKKKVTYKLKGEISPGTTLHEVKASYNTHEFTIRLKLGIDLPDRNSLKRLETLKPKVSLLLYPQSENTYRYMTVVETMDGIGIFAGYYSNTLFALK